MSEDKVAADDARQAASQDAAKVRAEKQVNSELSPGGCNSFLCSTFGAAFCTAGPP